MGKGWVVALALVFLVAIAPASAKTFWFVKPWDDPGGVVKYYKMGLHPVKSPYGGSDYWEWNNIGTGHSAYFDLYIPEAMYRDVKLTFTYGKDAVAYTGVKVFAFPSKPQIWSIYVVNPEDVYSQEWKVIFWSPNPPVFKKTVTITVPKGYPWVRVWCYDTDESGHYKVRLWKVAYYGETPAIPTPSVPSVSVEITQVAGYIGLATGLGLLAYALLRPKIKIGK